MAVAFSTDREVKALKAADKMYYARDLEVAGLRLRVTPKKGKGGEQEDIEAGKSWFYNYALSGKHRSISFGRYPAVSLKQARELCLQAKANIAQGVDPSLAKQQLKTKQKEEIEQARLAMADKENTFAKVAEEWFAIGIGCNILFEA